MIPLPISASRRQRLSTKLFLQSLEDRTTPATAAYAPQSQTLTIIAGEGDQIAVASLVGQPAGYIQVTEAQANVTVFDSTSAGQGVRNLIVKFGGVNSGVFTFDSGAQIGGSLAVSGAMSSLTMTLAGTVAGNVVYTANVLAAFDVVNVEATAMVGGNMILNLRGGTNTVRLKGGEVCGNMLIKGGAGDDTVEVAQSGNLTIDGSAALLLGNGSNSLLGKSASTVHIGARFGYVGGTGNDTVDLDVSGTDFEVGADMGFVLGSPRVFDANVVKFEAVHAGRNMVFVSGIGNDTVSASGTLDANGNVALNLGAGDNSFDSNVQGIGINDIAGNFIYIGGPDGDLVNLDGITMGKNMLVALGDSGGSSQGLFAGLKSSEGVTVFGSAMVTGGSDTDGILLRRTYIGSNLLVRTGAGTDTVAVDDINVAGVTLIDLGAGDDQALIETVAGDGAGALSQSTTFGGTVVVKGGEGIDTLNLSVDSDPTTFIQFGGHVLFIGGAGNDTLQNAQENVFKLSGNLNNFDILVGTAIV